MIQSSSTPSLLSLPRCTQRSAHDDAGASLLVSAVKRSPATATHTPVVNDRARCCDDCNSRVVLPMRLERLRERDNTKREGSNGGALQ